MPVAEDWRTSPHSVVNKVYRNKQEQGEPWELAVTSHFKNLLSSEAVRHSLPSLNFTPNHELTDGQLVRFRGMVQDMYDPEIYLAEYETRNLSTGVTLLNCGRYRDVLENSLREEVLEDSNLNVMKDRGVVYCVSIPGENAWVTEVLSSRENERAGPSTAYQNPLKRGLDPASDTPQEDSMDMETDCTMTGSGDPAATAGKRCRGEDGNPVPLVLNGTPASGVNGNPANDLNLPIPSSKGKAVIVKLYDVPEGEVKLCELLDMVGIVSLDPAMAVLEPSDMPGPFLPPPSLVPRLHVLHYQKFGHNNPLSGSPALNRAELEKTREQLLFILTQALLGDALSAEYLLCHLLSKVYGRVDIRVLGKMCLNLYNLNSNQNWSRRLYTLLSLLTPGSHYLPLSRNQLENTKFVPHKDFEANRLVSGILQLPAGTNLVIDETAMSDGQLSAKAVQNLTALGNLITWQKLDYDFKYHNLEYETDIPVMVMSEGRSLLPSDFSLQVKPEDNSMVETNFRNIGAVLNQDLLNRIRVYLTACRELEYSLTESLQKEVQEDFVRMRQDSRGEISVDDLHGHLILARLVAVSKGRSCMEAEDWSRAKEMELERRTSRSTRSRNGPSLPNGLPLHISAN